MSSNALHAKDLVKHGLPDLRVGPGTEKNDAFYRMVFAGTLEEWPDFEEHAWLACRNHAWRPRVLAHQSSGSQPETYLPTREMVALSDKRGLRGRLNQHVGQAMSGILKSQDMDMVFGDFVCTTADYHKNPDVACFDSVGLLKAVGDLKAWWVRKHDLEAALRPGHEHCLRMLLAQPAKYMQDLDLRYGFLSTYNHTIFL